MLFLVIPAVARNSLRCVKICNKRQRQGWRIQSLWLEQKHKHLPEMRVHSGWRKSDFPAVLQQCVLPRYAGPYCASLRGMKRQTGKEVSGEIIHKTLEKWFAGKEYIKVEAMQTNLEVGYSLSPCDQNETNNLQLRVSGIPRRKSLF